MNGYSFGMRGFWDGLNNRNIIILVNGMSQLFDYPSISQYIKFNIPVNSIERIEVVRGPMSLIYGQNAFFGAINIITDNYSMQEKESLLSFSAGSKSRLGGFFKSEGKEGNLEFVCTAGAYKADGPSPSYKDVSSNPFPSAWGADYEGDISGKTATDYQNFVFSARYNKLDFDLKIQRINSEGFFLFPSPDDSGETGTSDTYAEVALKYESSLSDNTTFSIKSHFYTDAANAQFYYFRNDFENMQNIKSSASENELTIQYTPNEKVNLHFGIYGKIIFEMDKKFDIPTLSSSLENTQEYLISDYMGERAIFSQLSYYPFNSTTISAGIRLMYMPTYKLGRRQLYLSEVTDSTGAVYTEAVTSQIEGEYNEDDIELIPRIAVIQKLNSSNIIKLLYGESIRYPSFFQNIKNMNSEKGALKPEYIRTAELVFITEPFSWLSATASIFYNILDDLIIREIEINPDGSGYKTWSENTGRLETHGLEGTLTLNPFDNLMIRGNFMFQKTEDKSSQGEGIDVAYSPRHIGQIQIAYRPVNWATVALFTNHVSSMETFWDNTPRNPAIGDFEPKGRLGRATEGFYNFSANARFRDIFHDGLSLSLSIKNIFDTKIRYPAFTNNPWMDRGALGPGREVHARVEWEF